MPSAESSGMPDAAPRPMSVEEVEQIVRDLRMLRESHVGWAEHFEAHPELEKQYIETGEWDDAIEHRRIIGVYDRVIVALKSRSLPKPDDATVIPVGARILAAEAVREQRRQAQGDLNHGTQPYHRLLAGRIIALCDTVEALRAERAADSERPHLHNGYDAAHWHESYRILADAVEQSLPSCIAEDDVAEEAIYADAIERAGTAIGAAHSAFNAIRIACARDLARKHNAALEQIVILVKAIREEEIAFDPERFPIDAARAARSATEDATNG